MEDKKKSVGELRREALCYAPKNGYANRISADEETAMRAYCEDYKKFLGRRQDRAGVCGRGHPQAEARGFKAFTRGMGAQARGTRFTAPTGARA